MIAIMRNIAKILLFTSLLVLSGSMAVAADTLRIHLTYKHNLNNAGQTSGYLTIKQQFYTPGNIFFREINYNEKTGQILNYTFLFYRDGKLFTQECHNAQDSILYILKHEYDKNGNESLLIKLLPDAAGKIRVSERSVKTYNSSHQVIKCRKYFGSQTGEITSYSYDGSGNLIQEKTLFKPIAKTGIRRETKDYSHSGGNKISQIIVSGKDLAGKSFQYREEYSYDANGLVSSIKKLNMDGSLNGEKVFKYLNSGAPSIYEEHDPSGRKTLLLQYDYKKHYMEMGTQVSYYENL
jgi:hypothetical protein